MLRCAEGCGDGLGQRLGEFNVSAHPVYRCADVALSWWGIELEVGGGEVGRLFFVRGLNALQEFVRKLGSVCVQRGNGVGFALLKGWRREAAQCPAGRKVDRAGFCGR